MATNNLWLKVGLKGAGKTQSGLKKVGGSVKGLTSSLLKAGAVFYGAKGLITGMQKSVQLAGNFKGVEQSFNNLGKNIGFTAGSLGKLDKALDGTVSKVEMMKQANNAMLLNIAENDDQMAELFDTAQRLAKAVGEDATFGVESLVTGLGRQSKLMLDNLGIMVDTNKLYEDHAKSLGKTVGQLTEQEKKQAFVNGALAQAKELANS